MLTGQLRNDIDKLWEKFWTGGITNPLTVIEQISYLMFARMLDMQEEMAERKGAAQAPQKQCISVLRQPGPALRGGGVRNRGYRDSSVRPYWRVHAGCGSGD